MIENDVAQYQVGDKTCRTQRGPGKGATLDGGDRARKVRQPHRPGRTVDANKFRVDPIVCLVNDRFCMACTTSCRQSYLRAAESVGNEGEKEMEGKLDTLGKRRRRWLATTMPNISGPEKQGATCRAEAMHSRPFPRREQ